MRVKDGKTEKRKKMTIGGSQAERKAEVANVKLYKCGAKGARWAGR
jgi:hypothetical protein